MGTGWFGNGFGGGLGVGVAVDPCMGSGLHWGETLCRWVRDGLMRFNSSRIITTMFL